MEICCLQWLVGTRRPDRFENGTDVVSGVHALVEAVVGLCAIQGGDLPSF